MPCAKPRSAKGAALMDGSEPEIAPITQRGAHTSVESERGNLDKPVLARRVDDGRP